MKILIPFWVVTAFIIIIAACLHMNVLPDFDAERITPNFFLISCGVMPLWKYPLLFVGIVSINPHMWFVCVIIYSYLLFYVIKRYIGLNQKVFCLLAYLTGLILFTAFTYKIHYPAHYWRNLWALGIGFYLALYEHKLLKHRWQLLQLLAVIEVYLSLYTMYSGDDVSYYMLNANIALAIIFIASWLFSKVSLRKHSFLSWFAGLSYVIYLIHGSMFNVQWYFWGHRSLWVIIISSVVTAVMLRYPINYLLTNISKKG